MRHIAAAARPGHQRHDVDAAHTWRSERGDARQRNGVSGSVRSGATGWASGAGSSGEEEGVRLPREAGGDVRVWHEPAARPARLRKRYSSDWGVLVALVGPRNRLRSRHNSGNVRVFLAFGSGPARRELRGCPAFVLLLALFLARTLLGAFFERGSCSICQNASLLSPVMYHRQRPSGSAVAHRGTPPWPPLSGRAGTPNGAKSARKWGQKRPAERRNAGQSRADHPAFGSPAVKAGLQRYRAGRANAVAVRPDGRNTH